MHPLARWFVILAAGCAALLESSSGRARAQQQNNAPIAYTGVVTDGICAGGGSHAAMMSKDGTRTAKDCTEYCVKNGAKYVLYIANPKAIYNLDDQDKAQGYAAEKVTIIGTYDGPSRTIHIVSIMVSP